MVFGGVGEYAATADASAPVATEILLSEETEKKAVFLLTSRGYWNVEFLAWFFARVHGDVQSARTKTFRRVHRKADTV